MYNPPNATPIIVEKISEEEFIRQTHKLREKRQTLQVNGTSQAVDFSEQVVDAVFVVQVGNFSEVEYRAVRQEDMQAMGQGADTAGEARLQSVCSLYTVCVQHVCNIAG